MGTTVTTLSGVSRLIGRCAVCGHLDVVRRVRLAAERDALAATVCARCARG